MHDQPQLSAEQLRSARAMLELSQAELAQRAGVGPSTIADFERGLRAPIANNVNAIKRVLEQEGVCFTTEGETVFRQVALHLESSSNAADLYLRDTPKDHPLIHEVVSVFGTPSQNIIDVEIAQKATASLKAALAEVVKKHAAAMPQLNKLMKFVEAVPDGEHFLLLPVKPITAAEKVRCSRFLAQLNNPGGSDDWDAQAEPLFGTLLERYDMSSPRTDRQTVIGTRRKLGERICRYCGTSEAQGAKFGKAAHAIATALGNDYLKSRDECDDCNGFFGERVEPSLIAWLNVQRVFLGIEGRGKHGGRPRVVYDGGELYHDGTKVQVAAKSVIKDVGSEDDFTVDLGAGTAVFIPQAAYRALVKMVLAVVDEEQLSHLRKTRAWVRHGLHADEPLPRVAASIINLPPNPSAQITVYSRLEPHPRLPHLVGEFRLGCFVYVFAVPFSDADEWNLVGFFDDPDFRNCFRHYAEVSTWVHHDFSGQAAGRITPRVRFERQRDQTREGDGSRLAPVDRR